MNSNARLADEQKNSTIRKQQKEKKNEGSGLHRMDHRLRHCGGPPLFGDLRQRQSAEIGAEEGEGIQKPENRHPDARGPDPET